MGCPWKLLYADDLMIVVQSLDRLLFLKVETWLLVIVKKGMPVSMGKTKILVSGMKFMEIKLDRSVICNSMVVI